MATPGSMTMHVGNDPLDPNRLSLTNGIQQEDFFVGPPIPPVNATPVRNITEYLARRETTDEFFVLKVLTLNPSCSQEDSPEDRQGKILMHNEYLVLSLLSEQPRVIQQYGLFKDGKRLVTVLECLHSHSYDPSGRYRDFVNLQHYVIKEKRLHEGEALEIFCKILSTVEMLHKKNIVHRDLKLGNIVFNTRTRELTLTNFALSKHLVRETEYLTDQRGSLAYVSPDVLSGAPYCGRASDMWSMGVLLYTMLYGQFPFYDDDPQKLFRKIRAAEYTLPNDGSVSRKTLYLLRELIQLDPQNRLTAPKALEVVQTIISQMTITVSLCEPEQIVPDSTEDRVADHNIHSCRRKATFGINVASNVNMNALQLNLTPLLVAESHASHVTTTTPNMGMFSLGVPVGGSPPLTVPPPVVFSDILSQHHHPHVRTSPRHIPIPIPIPIPTSSSYSPSHSLHHHHHHVNPFLPSPNNNSSFIPVSLSSSPPGPGGPPVLAPLGPPPPHSVAPTGPPSISSGSPVTPTSPPQTSPHSSLTSPVTFGGNVSLIAPNPNNISNNISSYPLVCHRYPLTLSLSSSTSSTSSNSTSTNSYNNSYSLLHSNNISNPYSSSLPPLPPTPHGYIQGTGHGYGYGHGPSELVPGLVEDGVGGRNHLLETVSSQHNSRPMHRHSYSYSEGERTLLALPHAQSAAPFYHRRRRNSSGSSDRATRRHSNPMGPIVDPLQSRRQRRRSHDVRDEQREILESLQLVAGGNSGRRTARSHSMTTTAVSSSLPED